MNRNPATDPESPEGQALESLETLIVPRARDLGGFEVRRVLPSGKRRMVGPFIFFDQVGPATIAAGKGIDVRPHPHIGLATVTYLYSGELQHRDSLGTNQMIYPGAVNWMIAGRGITHSERTSQPTRQGAHDIFGIQTWVALPKRHEETDPGFEHCPAEKLPSISSAGAEARLILGTAYGERAPVKTFSEMFYVDVTLQPGAALPLPDEHEERGVYISRGSCTLHGSEYETGQMAVFRQGAKVTMTAGSQGARLMLLGGETMDGPRFIWWNFVASSQEKIEAAKQAWREGDWASGRFPLPPDDKDEFTPLPDK